ncbi:MAG: hypothetical protein ACLFWB_10940, partial [Armatimonadota bacterium]
VAHTPAAQESTLSAGLKETVTLSDIGIQLEEHPASGYLAVTTDATVLNEAQVQGARQAAGELNASSRTVSLYLAEKIIDTDRPDAPMIAYAMVAGMQPLPEFDFTTGAPDTGDIPKNEVWLNSWAAADLGAKPEDSLKLTYLVPTTGGDYPTQAFTLRLGAVVEMEGLGADAALVPDFPGITEAETVGDWEAPFPVDMGLITERDEAYWHRYRAAPKAFVNPSVVRRMWQSAPEGERADWVTSVLVRPPAGVSVTEFARKYRTALLDELPPSVSGLAFRPVRQMALEASKGTSDFSQLFLGLSIFLVLSGAGLGGMLLRLLAQRRSQQAGIMQAVGYPAPLVGRALVIEGLAMTVIATVLGVPAGMGYAAGIIRALNNWWSGAVGRTGALWFHWTPASLLIGAISGLAIGTIVVVWRQAARAISRTRAAARFRADPNRFDGWKSETGRVVAETPAGCCGVACTALHGLANHRTTDGLLWHRLCAAAGGAVGIETRSLCCAAIHRRQPLDPAPVPAQRRSQFGAESACHRHHRSRDVHHRRRGRQFTGPLRT